ncbi:MAG TPA: nuclear transport factor 2 family protein, partial [Acidimicrobiales bacterium]
MSAEANRKLVTDFWSALYRRDWDRIGGFFTADSQYTDMPTPSDEVATGPEQILARLQLGLERISDYQ